MTHFEALAECARLRDEVSQQARTIDEQARTIAILRGES